MNKLELIKEFVEGFDSSLAIVTNRGTKKIILHNKCVRDIFGRDINGMSIDDVIDITKQPNLAGELAFCSFVENQSILLCKSMLSLERFIKKHHTVLRVNMDDTLITIINVSNKNSQEYNNVCYSFES